VRTDGTGKTTLYNRANNDGFGVHSFNVSDGWIYYSAPAGSFVDVPNTGFMKMRTDGTGTTRLLEVSGVSGISSPRYINIVGDWIIFGSSAKTYMIRTDGTGLREV
jgi:hypothetical protein